MSDCIKQFQFAHEGRNYVARVFRDEVGIGAPWDEHDGHGPVRQASVSTKRPGERIMFQDMGTAYLYDWQAACELARKDGWNAEPHEAPNRIERAVQADFDRMRAWVNDEWYWVGVGIVAVNDEGEFSDDDSDYYANALWGIESDSPDYHREVACELTGEINA